MIANARMYSVSPEAAELWRTLLSAIIATAGLPVRLIDHPEPAPMEELWHRTDMAAVFMCGLPLSRAQPQPVMVAAPVPSPAQFGGQARYWSDFVVRRDSSYREVPDTFGGRIAFTVPGSQSGCVAALSYFLSIEHPPPLYAEIIAPTVTPMGALSAVIDGNADIAPIDSYALGLLQRYRPDLTSRLRIVGQTAHTPIPPLVASRDGVGRLRSAFLEAHQNASITPMMDKLLLQRFELPDSRSYEVLRKRYETAVRYWGSHSLATVTHPVFVL